jgi:predicted GNAT superfamily acetyltransferase
MGMSDLVTARPESPAGRIIDAANDAAGAAARASGVQIRELSELADLQRFCALVDEIWHPKPGNEPVTAEFLRALAHAGNYVAGAFLGDELVGASVGFFASPAARAMHSHLAGVTSRLLGKHIGFALKLHQRAWALSRGVTAITWTFDPLVCRNAYFNIVKLAARPVEYLPDFYGAMDDDINSGDDSDRLLVHWSLADDSVVRASRGVSSGADAGDLRAAGAVVALDCDRSGFPAIVQTDNGAAPTVLVGVPLDIEITRRDNREAAHQWRRAMRQVLGGLLAGGGRVTGFDRSGWYVVERGRPTRDEASNPDRKASL